MTEIDTKYIDAIEAWQTDRACADARVQALDAYNEALRWLKWVVPKMALVDDLAQRLVVEGQRVLDDETEGPGDVESLLRKLRTEAGWLVEYLEKLGAER